MMQNQVHPHTHSKCVSEHPKFKAKTTVFYIYLMAFAKPTQLVAKTTSMPMKNQAGASGFTQINTMAQTSPVNTSLANSASAAARKNDSLLAPILRPTNIVNTSPGIYTARLPNSQGKNTNTEIQHQSSQQ